MQLTKASFQILDQLESAVNQIKTEDFVKACTTLGGSTIGQHLRHTLEFFLCLEKGFDDGLINYDKRDHDKLIESDKFIALGSISRIRNFIGNTKEDKVLKLEVGYERHSEACVTINTNYFRELTYNIEHAVHHMAIMKIGIRELAPYVKLSDQFGIAVSTIRYKETTAQELRK